MSNHQEPVSRKRRNSSLGSESRTKRQRLSSETKTDDESTTTNSTDQQTSTGRQWSSSYPYNGHDYPPITMNGGNLHQGDCYHYTSVNHQQSPAEQLLNSLRFPDMNKREHEIETCHYDTFEWIFDASRTCKSDYTFKPSAAPDTFSKWLQSDERMFWLAGKPGSGKSTLMKFMANHRQTVELLKARFEIQTPIILTAFFWLHGSETQRNLKGLLATLLRQLLQKDESLVELVLSRNPSLYAKIEISDWAVAELKQVFFQAIGEMRPGTCIFIDALDEMGERSANREVLNLIQDLARMESVKICASSRQEIPFETFFASYRKLRIHELTEADIRKTAQDLLASELLASSYGTVSEETVVELSDSIAWRAEGVFLWAIMAIKSLVIGLQNDDDLQTLYRRLEQTPRELDALFEQVWSRIQNNNQLYNAETSLILEAVGDNGWWYSSLLELTLADNETLYQPLLASFRNGTACKKVEQACDRMGKRVLACTASLVEVFTPTDLRSRSPLGLDPYEDEQTNMPKHPICTCSRLTAQRQTLSALQPKLRVYSSALLRFIHRSAAEFLKLKSKSRSDTSPRREILQRLFSAHLMISHLEILETPSHSFGYAQMLRKLSRALGVTEPCRFTLHSVEYIGQILRDSKLPSCEYGLFHGTFTDDRAQLLSVSDVSGFLCSLGLLPSITARVEHSPSPLSAYYMGYLVMCACMANNYIDFGQGHQTERRQNMVAGAGAILQLINKGADMQSPQLRCVLNGEIVLPRRPFIECYLFLLRARALWQGSHDRWPLCFRDLLKVLEVCSLEETELITCLIRLSELEGRADITILYPNLGWSLVVIVQLQTSVLRRLAKVEHYENVSVNPLIKCVYPSVSVQAVSADRPKDALARWPNKLQRFCLCPIVG